MYVCVFIWIFFGLTSDTNMYVTKVSKKTENERTYFSEHITTLQNLQKAALLCCQNVQACATYVHKHDVIILANKYGHSQSFWPSVGKR